MKMMRCVDIRLLLVTWLILLVAGCSNDDSPAKKAAITDQSSFVMNIYLPNTGTTRTGEEDDRNIHIDKPFERTIRSFRVWVFARQKVNDAPGDLMAISNADGATNGVLYTNVGSIDETVIIKNVAFNVEDGFNERYPYLDVYVIANLESLGVDESWCSTLNANDLQHIENTLEGLQLNDGSFGVSSLVSEAADTGLPMSGYVKKVPVSAQGVVYTTMDIKVKRAVSKIRFVFAKSPTTPEACITSVKLNTGMIPTTEYLFSGTAAVNNVALHETGYGNDYYGEIDFGAPATINTHVMPTALNWTGATSRQEWEDALNAAITNHEATEHVRAYLHESPQRLSGTLKYKLTATGDEMTATFQMAVAGQFLRNHSWTVYAFFTEGGLIYEVADWKEETVTFKPYI